MDKKIKSFLFDWNEKRKNNYYSDLESIIIMSTFKKTCRMFNYDFEYFIDLDNNIININIIKI